MLRATAGTTAMACQVLKIALRGLLISSGIGIAIWGLTEIISYFANASDKAAASTDNLQAQQEKAKRAAEEEERMRQQENQTLTDTRAQLELNIATLKNFNGTKEQEDKLVARMNNTYGDTMGYFSTVAGWYNALTKNSKAYCDQMIIEARIRKLVNEIAEIENKKSAIIFDESGKKKNTLHTGDGVRVQQKARLKKNCRRTVIWAISSKERRFIYRQSLTKNSGNTILSTKRERERENRLTSYSQHQSKCQ